MMSDRRREKTGEAPKQCQRVGVVEILLATYSLLVRAASRVAYGPSRRMCSFKGNLSPARSVFGAC